MGRRKQSMNDTDNKKSTYVLFDSVSLLRLFVEYAWNQTEQGPCPDNAVNKLINWLESMEMYLNERYWYDKQKHKLDIRFTSKTLLTPSIIRNESLLTKALILNDNIVYSRLTYSLRNVLFILRECKGDVNYQDDHGQAVLHTFLDEYQMIYDNFPENMIVQAAKLIKSLIKAGASVYLVDKNNKTPFDFASLCPNKEIMRAIISSLDINAVDRNGNTALHLIINCVNKQLEHKAQYADLVRVLVSRGADANVKNNKGTSPVQLAVETFDVEMLKFMANNGAKFDQRTIDDGTLLHSTCKSKLVDTSEKIDFLVSQGCGIEAVDKEGYMPLHYAAEFGSDEMIKRLIELGASVDCQTKPLLITPLYLAAKCDRLDNMKLLVKAGTNVNAEAADGSTALFMTVALGSLETMKYLINQGADVHQREKYRGYTLLHMAAHQPITSSGTVRQMEADKKFDLLMERGHFDVNDPGKDGITPLHIALANCNTDLVRILVERGADMNLQNDIMKWTALHMACIRNDLSTVKFLLENGANVNCRSRINQMTPLHVALIPYKNWYLDRHFDNAIKIEMSVVQKLCPLLIFQDSLMHNEVAMLLIDNQADVTARDKMGKSPLHWAVYQSSKMVIEKLLELGAQVSVPDINGRLPLHNLLSSYSGKAWLFELLLEYGADINDNDISRQIMYRSTIFQLFAVEHVIKLKLIHLPIANIYEYWINDSEFARYYNKCSNEAKALINHRSDQFSLYKFMHMSKKRQYLFTEKIDKSYSNLKELFPLYSQVIRAACREAINRRPFLNKAKIAWYRISTNLPYLPDVCVEHILSYLNIRYLEVLILSTKNNKAVVHALQAMKR